MIIIRLNGSPYQEEDVIKHQPCYQLKVPLKVENDRGVDRTRRYAPRMPFQDAIVQDSVRGLRYWLIKNGE